MWIEQPSFLRGKPLDRRDSFQDDLQVAVMIHMKANVLLRGAL
jgi:hypothetical protein